MQLPTCGRSDLSNRRSLVDLRSLRTRWVLEVRVGLMAGDRTAASSPDMRRLLVRAGDDVTGANGAADTLSSSFVELGMELSVTDRWTIPVGVLTQAR
jgi:hypothetical protein